jgi:hypothetical protein
MATDEADQKETCLGQDQQEGASINRKERQSSARSKTDKETVIWTLPRVPSGKLNESGREVHCMSSLFFPFLRVGGFYRDILRLLCVRSIPVSPNTVKSHAH